MSALDVNKKRALLLLRVVAFNALNALDTADSVDLEQGCG